MVCVMYNVMEREFLVRKGDIMPSEFQTLALMRLNLLGWEKRGNTLMIILYALRFFDLVVWKFFECCALWARDV